jgi:hypothetical protein
MAPGGAAPAVPSLFPNIEERHADLRLSLSRLRAVHGDAADGPISRGMRLPGLQCPGGADLARRTGACGHGYGPAHRSCRGRAPRERRTVSPGGTSRWVRLLRAPRAHAGSARLGRPHLCVERTADPEQTVMAATTQILLNGDRHGLWDGLVSQVNECLRLGP